MTFSGYKYPAIASLNRSLFFFLFLSSLPVDRTVLITADNQPRIIPMLFFFCFIIADKCPMYTMTGLLANIASSILGR